jgi:hypothetical protein
MAGKLIDHTNVCVTFFKGALEHLNKVDQCFHTLHSQMLKNGTQEPTIK